MDDNPYLSLIIPAYNEQDRIVASLDTIREYLESLGKPFEIIAVDDGSIDTTHQIMQDFAAKYESVRVVSYEKNRGKGYAVRQGVFASRGEYVAFSDADLSAPIDEMSKLIIAIEKGYDVAIGSRAVKGSYIPKHQPFYREIGGKGLNLIIRLLAVRGVHDTQCGFKLFTGEAATEIFSKCFINGWGFDVEVLYLARKLKYKTAEIGVKWSHADGSKIQPLRAALKIIADIIRMRLHKYDLL